MILPSKYNIALARLAYHAVSVSRSIIGKGDTAEVSRGGANWVLDLREGIDLTIFVTGYFQRKVVNACRSLLAVGDVAIDVGANMGAQTLHMAKAVGSSGLVVAVEPTVYPMERMARNLAANPHLRGRVRLVQGFLTASAEGNIPESVQSSWRLAGDRTGAHPVHRGVPQATRGAESMTLDCLVERERLSSVRLIKIDVDGAEDDVIAGAEKTISIHRPHIVMEVAPYTLIDRGLPGDAPLLRLKRLGYVFQDLDGRNLNPDHRTWVDRLSRGYGRDIIACPHEKNLTI